MGWMAPLSPLLGADSQRGPSPVALSRADLYRHYGIDANAIIAAAQAIAPGRPIRYLGAA